MCGQQSTQEPVSPRPGASRKAGKSAASLAEQGLVIQAGRGPLLRAAPSQGTHTGRQAAPWQQHPVLARTCPSRPPLLPPASLTQLPWKGCLQLPPPHLFSQPHLLGAVSSSSITRKAGQMPQGTFSWQSREKTGIWAHGKSRAQGKKASTPLAGVGAWGRSGCSQGPHLARPPWSCCGHSCCASPRLHVSLGSRWPPQHFTWVWHHSGHWQR